MTGGADELVVAIRDVVLAYERYDAGWRRHHALNANEKLVLLLLAEAATTPTELSRAISMTTAGMTNLLDRLEQDGYVTRERHATDRRRVLLTLTKRGLQASLEFDAVNHAIADAVDPDAAREVIAFLQRTAAVYAERTAIDHPEP